MKRSWLSLVLALVMVLSLCPFTVLAEESNFASGSGTDASPYVIKTEAQFKKLATLVNSGAASGGTLYASMSYQLGANIALDGVWTVIGSGKLTAVSVASEEDFDAAKTLYGALYLSDGSTADAYAAETEYFFKPVFSGKLNGKGYAVSGLTINKPSEDNQGLFGCVKGASIANLAVTGASVSGRDAIGILAGTGSGTTVTNCSVSGSANGNQVGGLVGQMSAGSVTNSMNNATVTGGSGVAGGVVGAASSGTSIAQSLSIGQVTGTTAGGILGSADGNTVTVNQCYYLAAKASTVEGSTTASQTASKALTGDEMKESTNYAGFDFTSEWVMNPDTQRAEIKVLAHSVSAIAMKTNPKTSYYQGDELSVTDGKITVSYLDGTSEDLDLTKDMVTSFSTSTTGAGTATVTYQGKTTTYAINVAAKVVTGIAIKTNPKTEYVEGTDLDLSAGVLVATYNNGDTPDVAMTAQGVSVSGYNKNTKGSQILSVSYGGKSTTLAITVVQKSVSSIAVKTNPTSTQYVEGTDMVVTGGELTVNYNNDTSDTLDMTAEGVTFSDYDQTKLGEQTVTVKYGGKEATFKVTVVAKSVTSIAVKNAPTKVQYLENKDLDPTGGEITISYNNGTSDDLAMTAEGVTFSGYKKNQLGEQTVTVKYSDKEATFTVTVLAKSVSSIAVKSAPTKVQYLENKDLELTGGVLTVYYNNDTNEEIAMTHEGVTTEGYQKNTLGQQTVTVKYSGKTDTFKVTVLEKNVQSISVESQPSKTSYIEGTELNLTGGTIKVNYDNDTFTVLAMTAEGVTVTGFDNTKLTNQTLTVKYSGKSTTFPVAVVAKSVTGIAVKTDPKLQYVEGTSLDLSAGEITVSYDNGTSDDLAMNHKDVVVSAFDNATLGEQELTLTYSGKSTTITVMVVAKSVTSIAMKTNPTKTVYIEGNTLALAGGQITVNYDNDTHIDMNLTDSGVTVTGFDNTKIGSQNVTVTYAKKTCTFSVTVNEKAVTSITIKNQPAKTSYIEGIDLDLTGGEITVNYDNGTAKDLSMTLSSVTVTGYKKNQLGNQTLTVKYSGKSTTFPVTVVAKTATSLVIKTNPTKTSYVEGLDPDLTDGILTISYDNNTSEDIAMTKSGVTVTGYDKNTLGDQTLTLTYLGQSCDLDVTVLEKSVTSVVLKSKPTKLTYIEGNILDLTGGVITVNYDNNTSETKNMSDTDVIVTGYDRNTTGTQTVTVTYEEESCNFTVTVGAKSVSSISIATAPTKTTYLYNVDALDVTGGVLNVVYNNGEIGTVNMTSDMVSNFSNTKTGNRTLTVTYNSKTTTFTVLVVKVSSITMTSMPSKTTYLEGRDELDLTDGEISITYSKTQSELPTTLEMTDSAVTASGFNNATVGTQTVVITYQGKSVSFNVTVTPKTLTAVTMDTLPTKTVYQLNVDTVLDVTGAKVRLIYDNGDTSSVDVTSSMVTSTPSLTTVGTKKVYVTYNNLSTYFEVVVKDRALTGIALSSTPTKVNYTVGDALDVTGGQIALSYDDGSSETLTMNTGMVSGYNKNTAGRQTLTVTYSGQTCTYQVTVTPNGYTVTLSFSGISGATTSTVWVDGVAYSATNGKVTLPNEQCKIATVYAYNTTSRNANVHDQYPTAMYVWALSFNSSTYTYTATRVSALDNVLAYAGSSIRITGNKGIRMITSVPLSAKNSLTSTSGLNGYTLQEYGTIVGWASKSEGTLVLNSSTATSAVAYKKNSSDPIYKKTSTAVQYTNVLTGFTTDQCKDDLAMRPYMTLRDPNGNIVTIYGGVVKRSIGYIAYQNRNAFDPTKSGQKAAYNYIWEIIHAVYGTTYDSEYKG